MTRAAMNIVLKAHLYVQQHMLTVDLNSPALSFTVLTWSLLLEPGWSFCWMNYPGRWQMMVVLRGRREKE